MRRDTGYDWMQWRQAGETFVRGHKPSRVCFWISALLLIFFYVVALFYLIANPRNFCLWTTFCVAAAPWWPCFYVLWSCSQFFPLERQRNTLEALRLTPIPIPEICRAVVRSRIRHGVIFLLACAPLYVAPHALGDSSGESAVIVNAGLCSTFWRPFIGMMAIADGPASYWSTPSENAWFSLFTGPIALTIDCTRLYALAAIGTIMSLRSKSQMRSLIFAIVWTVLFAMVIGVAEWIGGVLTVITSVATESVWPAAILLPLEALILQGWLGNVRALRGVLNSETRAAERALGLE